MDEFEDQLPTRGLADYWQIALRRRWTILLPLFFFWLVVWLGSWFIPSVYKSEAVILVEQQKVPEQYVVPNVTASLQDSLQSMTEQILKPNPAAGDNQPAPSLPIATRSAPVVARR